MGDRHQHHAAAKTLSPAEGTCAAALVLWRCISLAARHLQGSLRLEKVKATVEGKRMNSEMASEHPSAKESLKQEDVPAVDMLDAHSQSEATEQNVANAAREITRVKESHSAEVVEWKVLEPDLVEAAVERDDRRDDLADARLEKEEARQFSLKDALTGLPNRLVFDQLLEYGLSQAKRHQWGLAVLCVAVDQIKSINTADGHDQVLQMVATRITSFLRQSDTVSRWGGDQFVCLLPEVKHHADTVHVAERMIARITEPCVIDCKVLRVRASIGIAIFPAHGTTAETLLRHADVAMDEAKGEEARVVLFRCPEAEGAHQQRVLLPPGSAVPLPPA